MRLVKKPSATGRIGGICGIGCYYCMYVIQYAPLLLSMCLHFLKFVPAPRFPVITLILFPSHWGGTTVKKGDI